MASRLVEGERHNHNILWGSCTDPPFWSRNPLQYRMFSDSHVQLLLWGAS